MDSEETSAHALDDDLASKSDSNVNNTLKSSVKTASTVRPIDLTLESDSDNDHGIRHTDVPHKRSRFTRSSSPVSSPSTSPQAKVRKSKPTSSKHHDNADTRKVLHALDRAAAMPVPTRRRSKHEIDLSNYDMLELYEEADAHDIDTDSNDASSNLGESSQSDDEDREEAELHMTANGELERTSRKYDIFGYEVDDFVVDDYDNNESEASNADAGATTLSRSIVRKQSSLASLLKHNSVKLPDIDDKVFERRRAYAEGRAHGTITDDADDLEDSNSAMDDVDDGDDELNNDFVNNEFKARDRIKDLQLSSDEDARALTLHTSPHTTTLQNTAHYKGNSNKYKKYSDVHARRVLDIVYDKSYATKSNSACTLADSKAAKPKRRLIIDSDDDNVTFDEPPKSSSRPRARLHKNTTSVMDDEVDDLDFDLDADVHSVDINTGVTATRVGRTNAVVNLNNNINDD